MAETLKEWALRYADMGFAVFPVKTKAKAPATPNGCKDATTDRMKIETWWTICPDYNIGIATGSVSGGLVVIDLDIDEEKGKNGYEVFKQWQQEHGSFPETCQSITGRGGYHLLFRDSAQWGNRTGIYDGIDIRGEGGYIVAPPSLHESGRRYEWEQEPGEYKIAQVDNVVVDFLIGPPPEGWEKQGFEAPAEIPEGKRVSTLVALVGSLKSKGLADEAIRAAVAAENESRCIPALTETELQKEVFPALQRDWKTTAPYHKAVCDNGRARPPVVKKAIKYTAADVLMEADLPPVEHLVEGLLTPGLGGLSAKSKLGKSWMALQLSVDLASGDRFLGFTTKKCGVLYIDLENTPALTQERLRAILDGREPPKNLTFAHDFNLMGEGFEDDLVEFLEANPETKVVIIDVFQKVKRGKQLNQTDYEADYEILTKLKKIADRFGVCIMPIYHDRKFVDPTDPFSNLLGSTAIIGVSDFTWVLFKEKREDIEATLAVTGRTLREATYKLRRNGVKWENLGDAAALEATRKRHDYECDPVVNTIRRLVNQNNGKWKGRIKDIIGSSQYMKGCRIYAAPQKVSNQVKNRLKELEEYDAIIHYELPNGTASAIHVFESENPFDRNP